jgi:hypothetical protein
MLDNFGGKPEYAFAAYNAGDNRVLDWESIGNFKGTDEFVESIPFTETRDYVQAIVRNEMIYRELNQPHTATVPAASTLGHHDPSASLHAANAPAAAESQNAPLTGPTPH